MIKAALFVFVIMLILAAAPIAGGLVGTILGIGIAVIVLGYLFKEWEREEEDSL